MQRTKTELIQRIAYTDLVYNRINKKLGTCLSKAETEALIASMLRETDESCFVKKGKNYYITNTEKAIRLTINSFTCTVITADKIR